MKFYTCKYCYKEFEPKRRRVQKFCSNSCRSKAHHAKKNNSNKPALVEGDKLPTTATLSKIESMSVSGIGNAAAGNLLVEGLKSFLTADINKPATKGDINNLISLLNKRYLPIENITMNQFGQFPFYDTETQNVVYLNVTNNEKII